MYKGSKAKLKLSTENISRIHSLIKKSTGLRFAVPFSFFIGALISLIEFPCTGQIYVPIILLIQKQPANGYAYLFLYNIFFIVPLAGLFTLIYLGLDIKSISRIYSRHSIGTKIFFAAFFMLLFWLMLIL